MSVPILPLNEMSVEEKLQNYGGALLVSRADPAAIESPAWHEEELAERERKIESGEAKFVEWEKAKADIRRLHFVRIEILPEARDDLIAGFRFYEHEAPGLGSYFRESIVGDIDALASMGGVHGKVFGYHRSRVNAFPLLFITV